MKLELKTKLAFVVIFKHKFYEEEETEKKTIDKEIDDVNQHL